MLAISSLLLVVVISLLVTRVAAVILVATGLSRQAARFQARSAFTGAGFTTTESERVVDHPVRRRVIAALMLLGNAGVVASASSVILGFRGGAVGHVWWRVLELVAGLVALVFLSRSRRVDRAVTGAVQRLLKRFSQLAPGDSDALLWLSGGYAVHELSVGAQDWVAGRKLGELALDAEGVNVLGINHTDGGYLGTPTGQTHVSAGDVLVVHARREQVIELDRRSAGPEGDAAHRAAVAVRQQDTA